MPSKTEVAYQVVPAKVSISFARSTKRFLCANKTVKSLRRSSPALLRRYVLISFIAENERSHDAEVTGMVNVIYYRSKVIQVYLFGWKFGIPVPKFGVFGGF